MHASGGWGRGASRAAVAALGAGLLGLTSCVVLPVKIGPAVDGIVVDQTSGRPVADALVVVRFDGRYDDVLPDRDVIGHQEARSDASGRFRMQRIVRAGLSVWPLLKTEARVVAVMREGYRCAAPRTAPETGPVRIPLTPALDELDRRDSCRPVTAERGEVTAYMDAWRALFADAGAQSPDESERQVDRLLAARTVFGFGENCTGPVTDLAVAPDGARAAFRVAGARGGEVMRLELLAGRARPVAVKQAPAAGPGSRLAWVAPTQLVLWEPDAAPERAGARVAAANILPIWSSADAAPPAAPAPGAARSHAPVAFDPEDLSDERDTFWGGRSFALARTLDPTTGLAADELRVTREDGSRIAFALPGEACGPMGRFGHPHYRMAADGRTGFDLRFVGGGCHAVRIDLETGDWQKLDAASAPAQCERTRRVPAANLAVALRGYMREVEAALVEADADPAAAFVLEIADGGETLALSRGFDGERRSVRVPRFPLETPLRRIDVSTVGLARPAAPGAPARPAELEPL